MKDKEKETEEYEVLEFQGVEVDFNLHLASDFRPFDYLLLTKYIPIAML